MMNIPNLISLKTVSSVLLVMLYSVAQADTSPSKPVFEQLVDAQTTIAKGPYKGLRVSHNKGVLLTGTFIPSQSASSITKAAHLQKTPSKLTIRFSNAGGVPTIEDNNPSANPRGMAIRFELPNGSITDIVSLSINAFPVSTPEKFLGFLNAIIASKGESTKPSTLDQLISETPSLQRFIAIPRDFPVSFTTASYFGINAFEFINANGQKSYARYQIIPVNGKKALSPDQVKSAEPNYLFEELPERLKKTNPAFKLLAQIADKDDVINDPSVVWPDDRKLVELGIIHVEDMVPYNIEAEKSLAFNPLLLLDGIEPTNNPVLLARPSAYAVSVGRRLTP
ncbi:catalase family peroxidase [Methylotenera sp. L2L1]|uniref:catalase family peroxidase n=1 Tax=Methylotenera sp. L2L1 TaxID=1502770 RepID=UPI000691E4FE|nr:catalase family peroxidase [Methylotenera sp. L2L1]